MDLRWKRQWLRTSGRRVAAVGTVVAVGVPLLTTVAATAAVASPVLGPGGSSVSAQRPTKVIVRAAPGQLSTAEALVKSVGGQVVESLAIINGFSATVPTAGVAELSRSGAVAAVTPDGSVTLDGIDPNLGYDPNANGSLHHVGQALGANQAWSAGVTGAGVDVALIDSGVTPVPGLDTSSEVVNGPDLSIDAQTPAMTHLDAFGHGTNMASIIVGHDDTATTAGQWNNPSTYTGIAPGARLINVKVGSATGAVDVSQVIAGIDWVVQNAHSGGRNIKVLNLSFGTNSHEPYTVDPLDYAAEVAWRNGITVVASAGNDGSATTSLEDPADDPFVIAVGAENQNLGKASSSVLTTFSNTGNPDRTVDVLAPGVSIIGLRDPGALVDHQYPGARVGSRFFRGSGTSQAAAVVSGEVALLAQKFPTATPDELKWLVTQTAQSLNDVPRVAQGDGVIQIGKAVTITLGQIQNLLQGQKPGGKVTPQQLGTSLLPASLVTQPWVPSNGSGTLDGSRGGSALIDPSGAALTGETDVWGGAVNTSALAAAEATGSAWNGNSWDGNSLLGAGATPTLWEGTAESDAEAPGTQWGNGSWQSGDGLANFRWADESWDNFRWACDAWDNFRWAGDGWG